MIRYIFVFICFLILFGCQTMDDVWERSKQVVGLGEDTAEEPPTAVAEPTIAEPSVAEPEPTPQRTGEIAIAMPSEPDLPFSDAAVDPNQPLDSYTVERRPYAAEDQNFDVPPVSSLIPIGYHEPTPLTVAGGKLISTYALFNRLITAKNDPPIVINVLMGEKTELIPGSVWLSGAGNSGRFGDEVSQRLDQHLQTLAGGDKDKVIVFYCLDLRCWLSYNAAIRATNLGYSNVYWYRGGLRAWHEAGLPHFQSQEDRW